MLEDLKIEVFQALIALPKTGLVQGTSGNVSGRAEELVVIKPSGVPYTELRPEDLVVVDLKGRVVEGRLNPSVDTPAHLEIYKKLPEAGGVVHTHSTYATVFAALGRELPVYVTELADLLGGPVPISDYVPPGAAGIGAQFVAKTRPGRYRALLMRAHGVFTAAATPAEALKAAVIVEHSAKIACLAELLGTPKPLPQEEVEELHRKYTSHYGQRGR